MAVPRPIRTAGLAVLLVALLGTIAAAQTAESSEASVVAGEPPFQTFSGPPGHPRRHYRIGDPAELSGARAEEIYEGLRRELGRRYAESDDATAAEYQAWTRFNTVPYRSMTHGRRFVNNYANDIAGDYGKGKAAGRFPVGSVIAKDSFVVTAEGAIQPGPLFVMEKMPAGFNYVTGDWRYTMITKAGALAGRTLGAGAERVEFCIACHLAQEEQDHLYFVPKAFRGGS